MGVFNWYYLSSPPQILRFSEVQLESKGLIWVYHGTNGTVRRALLLLDIDQATLARSPCALTSQVLPAPALPQPGMVPATEVGSVEMLLNRPLIVRISRLTKGLAT